MLTFLRGRLAWSRIFNWAKREGKNKIMSKDSQNCLGGRWMQSWMTTRNRSIHLLLPLSGCSNMWFSGLLQWAGMHHRAPWIGLSFWLCIGFMRATKLGCFSNNLVSWSHMPTKLKVSKFNVQHITINSSHVAL